MKINMDKNWTKFPVLFSLYIAQSVPMSFFSTVVPIIMRQEHYTLGSIGLLQLVKLPWILKFLLGPLVDNTARNMKGIRKWVLFSELFYALIIVGIGFLHLQTDFKLIIFLVILAFIASASQDIATDIFAIRILRKSERGFGNTMQSGGSFIGSLLGTGVLLLLYQYVGWAVLMALLAVFVLVAVLPLMTYKAGGQLESVDHGKAGLKDVLLFFREKSNLKRLPLLIFFYSGIIGMLSMLKPFMVDLGYNLRQIGFLSGIMGTSVAAGATLLAGYLVKRLGIRTSFHLFSVISILVAVYFLYLENTKPGFAALCTGICLLWGSYGLSTVVIYTSSMNAVRKGREGTDFTVQIVITHLSSMLLTILCGKVGDRFGYAGLFTTEILFGILAWLLVNFNYPFHRTRAKYHEN